MVAEVPARKGFIERSGRCRGPRPCWKLAGVGLHLSYPDTVHVVLELRTTLNTDDAVNKLAVADLD